MPSSADLAIRKLGPKGYAKVTHSQTMSRDKWHTHKCKFKEQPKSNEGAFLPEKNWNNSQMPSNFPLEILGFLFECIAYK